MKRMMILATAAVMLAAATAEAGSREHRWSLGYEGYPTLRHTIGERWQISLGGGPDDYRVRQDERHWDSEWPDDIQGSQDIPSDNKDEEGFVRIGLYREMLRDGAFSMGGEIGLTYNWRNFQHSSLYYSDYSDSWSRSHEVGHRMNTTIDLLIRPSYDLTDRITLTMGFGVEFRSWTETADIERSTVSGSETDWSHDRRTVNGDVFDVVEFWGIDHIQLQFWF